MKFRVFKMQLLLLGACVLACRGCAVALAASPQAAAVVAVAVAVDDMLQTKTPALPDELGGGRADPSPAADVCRCGCGLKDCHCGKSGACLAKAKPVLSIDDDVLAAMHKPKTKLIVYRTFPCVHCDRLEQNAGHGDADILLEHANAPAPFPVSGHPVIFNPENRQYVVGYRTMDQIRKDLNLPRSSVKAIGAVTVGTINGDGLQALLDQIEPAKNGGGMITVSGASLTIPDKMPCAVSATHDQFAIAFPGPKPRVAYGSGWLAVSQPVNGITASRSLLTIGLDGFPDIALKVEQ